MGRLLDITPIYVQEGLRVPALPLEDEGAIHAAGEPTLPVNMSGGSSDSSSLRWCTMSKAMLCSLALGKSGSTASRSASY